MRSKGLLQDFANDQLDKPQQRARTYSDASQRAEDEDYELIRGLLSCLSVCLSVCLPACLCICLTTFMCPRKVYVIVQERYCNMLPSQLSLLPFTVSIVSKPKPATELY